MVKKKIDNENNGKEKDGMEIDLGIGKIAFGGLFKGIGNLMDLAAKLDEQGVSRSGEIAGLPKNARGVYGFSIKTMGGKPVIETFGNVKESARGPVVEETWEPIVDIFNEKDHVLIVCELPGVSKDKVKISISGDIVNLTASNHKRKYAKEILLPCKVKTDSLKTSYENGLLEVSLTKEN
jgi:HSP20 family protein